MRAAKRVWRLFLVPLILSAPCSTRSNQIARLLLRCRRLGLLHFGFFGVRTCLHLQLGVSDGDVPGLGRTPPASLGTDPRLSWGNLCVVDVTPDLASIFDIRGIYRGFQTRTNRGTKQRRTVGWH